jgi:four helix bundle protein
MAFMFEKLEVYQKGVDFADRVTALTERFPKGFRFLSDQLNRAALSIPANLAEGNGRWHTADRKQFFWIARGSAQECVPLMEVGFRRGLITDAEHKSLKESLETIVKMTSGLIQGVPDRKKSS